MKKVFLFILSMALVVQLPAQGVPNLIPPSPEAASIVGYGNTGVNFYTGSPSLSIPIYTATSRGVSIPVSLSYSGFGGHKVEAVAPWVGLGWSLNAGGVVSRTIRGLADDGPNGYQTMAALPNLDNSTIQTYQDYADGDYDGEPDEYNFNVNGMSGTFYINKSKQVVLRTKTDVKVTPVFASPSSKVVTHFEVTGTDGTTYVFAEKEKSKSFALAENASAVPYQTSSWYLSEVKDQNGLSLITLEYYDWSGTTNQTKNILYNAQSELDLGVVFTGTHMNKSWNYTEVKRIKQINYDHGKILFNKSATKRQDHLNDYWLDNIEIKDKSDNLIKKFTLDYSYFTPTGTAAINSAATGILFQGSNTGDYERRLKLDAITEWDKNAAVSNPPHTFTYNTTHYLPSRYSFAQDHWGYYNGQTGNANPEPVQKVTYYDGWSNPSNVGFGTANREPSEAHAQAGILTKVTYPTGGHTSFTFGGHHAVEDDLKNDYVAQTIDFDPDGNWSPTDVNISLIHDPHETIDIKVDANHTCDIQVNFYPSNNTSQIADGVTMEYIGGPIPYSHGTAKVTLVPGTYKVKATILDPNLTGCAVLSSDNVRLEWDNEVLKVNKDVGGLRIEAIEDHDGIDAANDIRREFYYNEAGDNGTSNSTGRVVNVPQYGEQVLLNDATTAYVINLEPNGYRRTMQSNYPLMKTNGSEVGYGKVTVRTIGAQNNGKTEYYFTTSDDIADLYDGYYYSPLSGETYTNLLPNSSLESYPYTRADSRDYIRGLLTKQIDYRWKAGNYYKTKEVENTYVGTYNAPKGHSNQTLPLSFPVNSVATNGTNWTSIEGAIWKPGVHNHFKRYRFYSGRVDLQKTVTKSYDLLDDTGTLYTETETTNFWDDLADDHYQISRTQSKDSEGNTYETKMYYPYDSADVSGLDLGDRTVLGNMIGRNMIGSPIQQEQYKGATKLSTTRTVFRSFTEGGSQYYLPGWVQTAKGLGTLETRVRYHSYDSKGNPRELSQENGTHIVYLWGYNQTFPVAQIQNATYTEVSAVINQSVLDNPASDVALRTELDKLRAAGSLKQSLVTTMTYDVTIGMTSQTTPNGLTTYYEYDSFNRLKYVKDKDGNILRKMEYSYKVNANTTNN